MKYMNLVTTPKMIIVYYPNCHLILMYFYTRSYLCLKLTALIHAALFPKHQKNIRLYDLNC